MIDNVGKEAFWASNGCSLTSLPRRCLSLERFCEHEIGFLYVNLYTIHEHNIVSLPKGSTSSSCRVSVAVIRRLSAGVRFVEL